MKFNAPGAILQAARVTFRATNLNHRPMESIMSNPRIILRTIAAAAVGTAVVVSTAQAANTKASFRDVLQPNGQTRSTAEKFADGAACGMSPRHHIRVIMPVFEQCMASKGWTRVQGTGSQPPSVPYFRGPEGDDEFRSSATGTMTREEQCRRWREGLDRHRQPPDCR